MFNSSGMVPGFMPRFCSMVPMEPSRIRKGLSFGWKRAGLFDTGLSFLCERAGIEVADGAAADGLELRRVKDTCQRRDGFFGHHEQCVHEVQAESGGQVQFPEEHSLVCQGQVAVARGKAVREVTPQFPADGGLDFVQPGIHKRCPGCIEKQRAGHVCHGQAPHIPVKGRSQGDGHEDHRRSSL